MTINCWSATIVTPEAFTVCEIVRREIRVVVVLYISLTLKAVLSQHPQHPQLSIKMMIGVEQYLPMKHAINCFVIQSDVGRWTRVLKLNEYQRIDRRLWYGAGSVLKDLSAVIRFGISWTVPISFEFYKIILFLMRKINLAGDGDYRWTMIQSVEVEWLKIFCLVKHQRLSIGPRTVSISIRWRIYGQSSNVV